MRMLRTLGMLALCATLGGMIACGGARTNTAASAAPQEPGVELERAMRLFRRGDFRRAQVAFLRLTFELGPGQPELAQVRYYLAECSFQMGDRVQAATEFRRVADEFPATQYAPMALLRAGDANLRLWHRPELDPTYGEAALAIYQELAGRYPESDAAARARPHVKRLEGQFADKAYKNGMFYLRRKAYDSAIIYFKDVIASYPNAQRAPDALLCLVESYRAIGYTQEVLETCEHLRRFYPSALRLDRTCPTTPTPGTPS